jgi:hypothetical protein
MITGALAAVKCWKALKVGRFGAFLAVICVRCENNFSFSRLRIIASIVRARYYNPIVGEAAKSRIISLLIHFTQLTILHLNYRFQNRNPHEEKNFLPSAERRNMNF